jgi:hypothetical protein
MIPYEDLVIALQTWRAKQGLPVAQLSGALTPPPAAPAYTPMTTPPGPPPPKAQGFIGNVATPPPLAAPLEDSLDVDDAALLEETHYENEGDDFAMAFAGTAPPADEEDSTAIGHQPPPLGRPSEMTLDEGGTEVAPPGGKARTPNRNDDW